MKWSERQMKNVDERIEELKKKNKGKYITQGVSFNKECPRQMALLKFALENSASFSGLIKELLAVRFESTHQQIITPQSQLQPKPVPKIKSKNVGNFI